MSLYTDIRGALNTRLEEAASDLPEIAWEGMYYRPRVGVPYMQVSMVPAVITMESMGPAGLFRHEGSYEVTLVYPSDEGTANVELMADTIRAAFRAGDTLELSGTPVVRVLRAERGQVVDDVDWIRVNVSVRWYTYTDVH